MPFPTDNPKKGELALPILIGLVVYFILAVLEPFGTDQSITPNKPIRLIGYGFISGGMVYFFENFVPRKMAKFYNVDTWTIGKAVAHGVVVLFAMGCVIWWYTTLLFPNDPAAPGFARCILYTFILGVIPVIIITGWNYIRFLERKQALIYNTQQVKADEKPIDLLGTTNGKILSIMASRIILCTAMGNYVLVHFEDGTEVRKQMIRKTLSSLMKDLPENRFLRCHRSHLVNMEKVIANEGNSKGIRLTLSGIDEKIQVSRSFVPALRQWISKQTEMISR